MPNHVRHILNRLESRGYVVLGVSRDRFRIAGIRGWRNVDWAVRVLNRERACL